MNAQQKGWTAIRPSKECLPIRRGLHAEHYGKTWSGASSTRGGFWVSVVGGSPDRAAQVPNTESGEEVRRSSSRVIFATKEGCNILFNFSEQSVSVICKLTESSDP